MAVPPVASWGTAAERRCHQEPTYVIFHAQIAEALLLAGEVELARGRKIVSLQRHSVSLGMIHIYKVEQSVGK